MLMPMVWSSLGVWVPRALRPFECLRAHIDLGSLSWGNRGIAQFTYMRNCLEGMHKQALLWFRSCHGGYRGVRKVHVIVKSLLNTHTVCKAPNQYQKMWIVWYVCRMVDMLLLLFECSGIWYGHYFTYGCSTFCYKCSTLTFEVMYLQEFPLPIDFGTLLEDTPLSVKKTKTIQAWLCWQISCSVIDTNVIHYFLGRLSRLRFEVCTWSRDTWYRKP